MIRYSLRCAAGHDFESWFRDSEAFESQAQRGELACPICGSSKIEKQIMAPAVAQQDEASGVQPVAMQSLAVMGDPAREMNQAGDLHQAREMRAMLRAFRQHLETHAENVGTEFADEARKIHYGETEERAIYGETSFDEAKALHEEGIEILPVPKVPDDMN